ncbi:MAG TPA: hypothetical protein VF520_15905 [Thermoleophilaceae bacterium]|jgi:hypothetical protein
MRRSAEDQTMWSVPALTIAAQAFVLTAVLDPDTSREGRVIACGIGIAILSAALYQMTRHRYFETIMSRWLTDFERTFGLPELHNFSGRGGLRGYSRRPPRLPRVPRPSAYVAWCFLLAALTAVYVVMLYLSLSTDVFDVGRDGSRVGRANSQLESVGYVGQAIERHVRVERKRHQPGG